MAKMIPDNFPSDRKDLGGERVVFNALKMQLGDDFTVLWSINTKGSKFRQIDFLVLHPKLGLAVLEVKGGIVTLGNPWNEDRRWPATTRKGVPIDPVDNPFMQARTAGAVFMKDLRAKRPISSLYAVSSVAILPHTPRPADAEAVLGDVVDNFLFQDDLDQKLLRRRLMLLMEQESASPTQSFSPPGVKGIATIVEVYGDQHQLPPTGEIVDDLGDEVPVPEVATTPVIDPATPPPSMETSVGGRNKLRSKAATIAAGVTAVVVLAAGGYTLAPTVPPKGKADLLDTATLDLGGRHLPLAGLKAINRPEAVSHARQFLIQAGDIACEPSEEKWRCVSIARNVDIAEVFVLSGYATAEPGAAAPILQAENSARMNRRGVWGPR